MKISELMDRYSDDTVELQGQRSVDLERVRRLTHARIRGTKHRRPTKKICALLLAAALAVGAVTGGAVAVVNQLRASDVLGGYVLPPDQQSRPLTEEEKAWLEDFSAVAVDEDGNGVLPSVTSNGTTITPTAVIYDGHELYVQFRIEAPEGVAFEDREDEGFFYHLSSSENRYFPNSGSGWFQGELYDANGDPITGVIYSETEPNVLIVNLTYSFRDANRLTVMHIDGVELEDDLSDEDTQILTGSWDFDLGAVDRGETIVIAARKTSYDYYIPPRASTAPDVFKDWPGGTIQVTLDSDLEITPLGVYCKWHYNENLLEGYEFVHEVRFQVIYKDGTEGTVPYDLERVDYVLVDGTRKLPADTAQAAKEG